MSPVIPAGFTRAELLACLDREIRLRERVYPRQVEMGRMSSDAARRETERMRAVRAIVAQLAEPSSLHASLFGCEKDGS